MLPPLTTAVSTGDCPPDIFWHDHCSPRLWGFWLRQAFLDPAF